MTTRDKILAAAMRHFAEKGFEGASTRVITELAGVNAALINYHFGSKLNLFRAVLERSTAQIYANRMAALDELEARFPQDPPPIEAVIRAYATPLMSGMRDPAGDLPVYMRFFGRLFTEHDDALAETILWHNPAIQTRTLAAFQRSLPDLPLDNLTLRLGLMIGAMSFACMDFDYFARHAASEPALHLDDLIENFVVSQAALFRAAAVPLRRIAPTKPRRRKSAKSPPCDDSAAK